MEFTPEQLDQAVDLWETLVGLHDMTATTQGYYQHSTRHLSAHVKGDSQGNAYRMPNREEIRALILSDGEEAPYPDGNPWNGGDTLTPITITLASYGDGYGSDLDAANVRALDGTPGVTVAIPGRRDDGGSATCVIGEMSSFANAQGDEPSKDDAIMWLRHLVDTMAGLESHALIDEEKHGEYEREMIEEAWDNYLLSDIEHELREATDWRFDWSEPSPLIAPDDPRDLDDIFREAYMSYEENEWVFDSATSIHNNRHRDAVRYAASTVLAIELPA